MTEYLIIRSRYYRRNLILPSMKDVEVYVNNINLVTNSPNTPQETSLIQINTA